LTAYGTKVAEPKTAEPRRDQDMASLGVNRMSM
jgi:hypothetical protein